MFEVSQIEELFTGCGSEAADGAEAGGPTPLIPMVAYPPHPDS